MATSSTYYLNAPSLASATAVFTDSGLTTYAPNGYYSNGVISRQQISGVLSPAVTCPACPPAYATWYASGIVSANPCSQAIGQVVYTTWGTAWNSINKFWTDTAMTTIYEGTGYISYTDIPYDVPKYSAAIAPISGDLTAFTICP